MDTKSSLKANIVTKKNLHKCKIIRVLIFSVIFIHECTLLAKNFYECKNYDSFCFLFIQAYLYKIHK